MKQYIKRLKMLKLSLLLTVGFLSLCEAEVFHVTPTIPATQPCPPPCHTLDQYTQNTSLLTGHTNISLVFLEGAHNLSYRFAASGLEILVFQGQGELPGDTVINFVPPAYIYLSDIIQVSLFNIHLERLFDPDYVFSSSGYDYRKYYNDFVTDLNIQHITFSDIDTNGAIRFSNIIKPLYQRISGSAQSTASITFLKCNFKDSTLHLGAKNIKIEDTSFSTGERTSIEILSTLDIEKSFFSHWLDVTCGATNCTVKAHDVDIFSMGFYGEQFEEVIVNCGSGNRSTAIIHTFVQNMNKISISDCNMENVVLTSSNHVLIHNTTISNSIVDGLYIKRVQNVTITDSSIINNVIGITSLSSGLTIQNTVIARNSFGVIAQPYNLPGPPVETLTIFLSNCTISHNSPIGIVLVNIPTAIDIVINDCNFYENQGTPITVYQSTVELRGENIFQHNIARRGGGLALFNSSVIFGSGSNTILINNTAVEFGGGIYIANLPIIFYETDVINTEKVNARLFGSTIDDLIKDTAYKQNCFYSTQQNSSIIMAKNTATLGGFDIFGATIYNDQCNSIDDPAFRFDNETLNTFKISSDPTRACFCVDNSPLCENRTHLMLNQTRYPGESFTVSVALTGYYYGRVAGSVYANILGQDYKRVIKEDQHIQRANLIDCKILTYTVFSEQTSGSIVLVLSAQEQFTQQRDEQSLEANIRNVYSRECTHYEFPCTALLTTPVYINITLEDCPIGFHFDNTSRECKCNNEIHLINSSCEIRDHIAYINREGTVWVGVDTGENNTDTYSWHRYCPRDYCISSQTSIDLRSPDEQCSSNRSGIICGQCRRGYSLQLGGNKCLSGCSNNFSALITAFATLGILLVVLIKLLDLTVSSGTVSGLIFYANVVWRNNAILFAQQGSMGYYIITVPIAWINLDFGIETCFTENLNQLTKTGLQFVFPVYIWCIAGLIILVSHYSTRATKLFGNNSVAVLATLFLLSYGKIFRNITDVFTFADMPSSNDTVRKVWALDGNVRYGVEPGHIVLMLLAILFLVLFLLPFTLTLLLVPFLRAKSQYRPLHWVNTLKPFFDTFYGPFNDMKQHHIWTGILLISRVVILIVLASTSTYSPNANILLMTMVSMLLIMYSAMVGLLYKKWILSLLENLYLLNLMMLGCAFLFYHGLSLSGPPLNPITATSVVLALFSFVLTVIVYTVNRITKTWPCLTRREGEEVKHKEPDQPARGAQEEGMGPTVQVIELKKDEYDPTMLRETLLETSH